MARLRFEDLKALRPLLEQALDLPEADRAAWIRQQRISQPTLAGAVEELLQLEASLDQQAFLAREQAPELPASTSLEGQALGPYRLQRPLGAGGMGSVWLARRDDGRYEGAVAIKFLNLAVAGPVGEARFRREGSLLARLTHPNIAGLLNAGVAPTGQPYLVLEHVDGETIDKWCDAHQPSVETRVRLFIQVLTAVAHAHANLVVHRDLKPSNIMVTTDGTVKLLDFGIAKLLEGDGLQGGALTGSRDAMMTLEYAAPEQVKGDPISTATDVYSLAVVFYRLLAGEHPTGAKHHTPADQIRGILDTQPSPLPTALVPRGDLDKILAKALRKEPVERYATANAFAEDLTRFLNNEPVSAAPETVGQKVRRFYRRNRALVSSAVIVLLVLIGATIVTANQARIARQQRDAALEELRRSSAGVVMQEVLAGDERGADGRQLSAAERIEMAIQVLSRRYRQHPWLVSEVMTDLAGRFYDSGDRATERKLLGRALLLARESNQNNQIALAACRLVYSYAYDEVFDSAATALAEAKRVTDGFKKGDIGALHICLDAEGQLLVAQGKPDSAIPLLTKAVALARENTSEGDLGTDYLSLQNDLAQALRAAGQTREAARVQIGIVQTLDSTGSGLTTAMTNISSFVMGSLQELGEFALSDSILRSRVQAFEKVYGPGQPPVLMGFSYGLIHLRMGRTDSANAWLEWTLRDTTNAMAAVPAWMPTALSTLRLDQHRPAEARAALEPYVVNAPIREAYALVIRSRIRAEEGDSVGARKMLEEGARRLRGDGPRPATFLSLSLVTAADWRLLSREWAIADSLAGQAIQAAAIDSLALTRSGYVGRAELIRARAAAGLGRRPEAVQAASRAVIALGNGYGPEHPRTREARALRDSLGGGP